MIIIYSQNTILLYMFRASSAHLQEDTVVYKQHMVPSLSIRVPGGTKALIESDGTICCLYTTMFS